MSVSDTSVVQNQVDRRYQSYGASILGWLFKELQKIKNIACLGEWNQFLGIQVESTPNICFGGSYCDQFPSIFHFDSKAAVFDPRLLSLKRWYPPQPKLLHRIVNLVPNNPRLPSPDKNGATHSRRTRGSWKPHELTSLNSATNKRRF